MFKSAPLWPIAAFRCRPPIAAPSTRCVGLPIRILDKILLPEFLDRYLAKHAYEAQKTKAAVSPTRKDKMAPVGELHRTHGSFDAEAANRVMAIPGPAARFIPVALTALTGVVIGFIMRGLLQRSR